MLQEVLKVAPRETPDIGKTFVRLEWPVAYKVIQAVEQLIVNEKSFLEPFHYQEVKRADQKSQ